jgi:hypothetical protein
VLDEAASHARAEAADGLAEGLFVEVPCRHREGGDARPGVGVARRVEGEEVVEVRAEASCWVKASPRLQLFRKVAISEVSRYMSVATV